MSEPTHLIVGPYCLALGRYYDRETHMWVDPLSPTRLRCGLDPLGSETSGDVVALSFEPPGTRVERGGSFGSLEAAKFVGPLTAPVSGIVTARNEALLAEPGRLNRDPLESWLIEIEPDRADEELGLLVQRPDRLRSWFEAEVERFKREGMLAP